jgi:hypothetical protein
MGCIGTGLKGIFNIYIRLRDAAPKTGLVTCVTCRRKIEWYRCDSGHFVHGDFYKTSYYEKNVHGQCRGCNVSMHIKPSLIKMYRNFIVSSYGVGVLRYIRRIQDVHFIENRKTFKKLHHLYKMKVYSLLVEKKLKPNRHVRHILNDRFFKENNLKPI